MPQVQVIPPILEQAKKIKVAAYARVSSDSVDQLNSFSSQVEYYTDYIQSKEEWEFAGLYADEAVTGTTTEKRSDFQRLLADCHAGKIDRILVKSISRFARNTLDCIQTVRELKRLGIAVEFEKENIDTGSLGSEMLLSILGAAAQEESLSISKNLKWSYRRRMRSGDFITCSAPLGYFLKNNTLVPDPQEVPIVEYIFNSYLAGKGMEEIAKKLTLQESQALQKKSSRWHHSSIRYILTNEKYIGDALVQKSFTPDEIPLKRIPNSGQVPQYYINHSHPMIISPETFDAVQELIKRKTAFCCTKTMSKSYPLSKIMKCGECGSTFHRHPQEASVRWFCYRHLQDRASCTMRAVTEQEIYTAFLSLYNRLYHHKMLVLNAMLKQLEELKNKSILNSPDIIGVHQKISILVRQNHSLSRLQAKGCMDSAVFIEQSNRNHQAIEALRLELRRMQRLSPIDKCIANTKLILDLMDHSSPLLEFDSTAFKHMVENIIIDAKKFYFHLTNGLILEERRTLP